MLYTQMRCVTQGTNLGLQIVAAKKYYGDIVWTLKMCLDPAGLVFHGLGEQTSS